MRGDRIGKRRLRRLLNAQPSAYKVLRARISAASFPEPPPCAISYEDSGTHPWVRKWIAGVGDAPDGRTGVRWIDALADGWDWSECYEVVWLGSVNVELVVKPAYRERFLQRMRRAFRVMHEKGVAVKVLRNRVAP
jgi:hypothetical protein